MDDEQVASLRLMRDPTRWVSIVRMLSVRKRTPDGGWTKGVMYAPDRDEPRPEVVECDLERDEHALGSFEEKSLARMWKEAPKHTYDSLEDVVADGWIAFLT